VGLDDLFGLLFVLYILGSILSALMRGPSRRTPGMDDETADEIFDMEDLERRLRRMREEMVDQPPAARPTVTGEDPESPTAGEPVASAPVRPEARPIPEPVGRPSAVPPSPMRPSPLRPFVTRPSTARPSDTVDGWPDLEEWRDWPGDHWELPVPSPDSGRKRLAAVRPQPRPSAQARRASARPAGTGLPPAAAALLEGGRPWLAAVVIKELWDQPRALRPHRPWPRV